MKSLTKIMVFVLVVTIGIAFINTSLSALRDDCYCQNDSEAEGECVNNCWDAYRADCLMVVAWDWGCEFTDCVTAWKFYCDNGARGYFYTEWHYCWDCD
jgi:hypothetical protein